MRSTCWSRSGWTSPSCVTRVGTTSFTIAAIRRCRRALHARRPRREHLDLGASDALCAGLQINNHLQDCAKDYKNLNRVYLPRDALAASGASVEMLGEAKSQPALLQCLQALAVRTETLLNESKSLAAEVKDFRSLSRCP